MSIPYSRLHSSMGRNSSSIKYPSPGPWIVLLTLYLDSTFTFLPGPRLARLANNNTSFIFFLNRRLCTFISVFHLLLPGASAKHVVDHPPMVLPAYQAKEMSLRDMPCSEGGMPAYYETIGSDWTGMGTVRSGEKCIPPKHQS